MNGYDSSVPLGTSINSSGRRGKRPGDHCFKVDDIPQTRKHMFISCLYSNHYPLHHSVSTERVIYRLVGSAIYNQHN